LVTAGYTDEAVLPLVESRVPVSSVRRIVVKHSESIEETAALFSRYLKMLWQDPRYSRVALGLPGVLILIWCGLAIAQVDFFNYILAIVLVGGSFMLIKGFGVDRTVKNFYKWAKEYSPPRLPVQVANYATIAGILCLAVSVYSGYSYTANNFSNVTPTPVNISGWLSSLPELAGYFIQGSIDLIIVGLCTILLGRGIRMYFDRDARVLRNAVLIVCAGWSRMIFAGAAEVLINPVGGLSSNVTNLIFFIIVGILIAIASVLLTLIIHRSAKGFFIESKEKANQFDEGE
jgi:putative membrane protein